MFARLEGRAPSPGAKGALALAAYRQCSADAWVGPCVERHTVVGERMSNVVGQGEWAECMPLCRRVTRGRMSARRSCPA